ncbi:PDGLE domain-containing protein [Candidatus Margulisiibacteriota bacterium]
MNKKTVWYVILISIIVAILASYFASASPDGLEKVAETFGFIEDANGTFGFFSDYTLFTGIIGLLIIFATFKGIGLLITKASQK